MTEALVRSGTADAQGPPRGPVMRRFLFVAAVTVAAAFLLVWGARAFGTGSAVFAFLVVWVPMTWLGTASRVVQPRLPRSYHELRDFERDGGLYESLGVRLVKALLRRGPLAMFNPDLHLPAERSPERLAHLAQRMRDAEASHAILFVVTMAVAVHAAARGWWTGAGLTLLFDVLMNGYPIMLQRYNRALLYSHHHHSTPRAGSVDPECLVSVAEQRQMLGSVPQRS